MEEDQLPCLLVVCDVLFFNLRYGNKWIHIHLSNF